MQGAAFHMAHGEEGHAIGLPHVEERTEHRVIQSRESLGFAVEATTGRGRERRTLHELERHIPRETIIAREPNLTLSAPAQRPKQPIWPALLCAARRLRGRWPGVADV